MDKRQQVLSRAEKVFGDKGRAAAWAVQVKSQFGGMSALECAETEDGYLLVMETLAKVEHGFGA
ncbi:MbcA/ParS/Xre antitoxin family protein [Pseudomonas sp. NEEL19]|uniref:MbcA/ParS/Xre antitoxin family protein n=1 Tax=Pseudomonas sp. NEEL19 TaxID=2867409 RepID=UPI0023680313|nr:MbcA/ParS/Xre antitoxin family protein [Pseudomonas sp. NEEL19]WDM57704.1 MbcA/ParS/Xre antitoxin family protein [Pseudomonas sp. NEEL19]